MNYEIQDHMNTIFPNFISLHLTPIIVSFNPSDAQIIGSGFFFNYNDKLFIGSAKHVLDSYLNIRINDSRIKLLCHNGNGKHPIILNVINFRLSDCADIGYLQIDKLGMMDGLSLEKKKVKYCGLSLEQTLEFVDLQKSTSTNRRDNTECSGLEATPFLCGYPDSAQCQMKEAFGQLQKDLRIELVNLRISNYRQNVSYCNNDYFGDIYDLDYTQAGDQFEYVSGFRENRNPIGFSGGPVFIIQESPPNSLISPNNTARIIAIQSSWNPSENILYATDIQMLVKLIQENE